MDLNKLTQSERIIGVTGVLLLVTSFLPWFRKCFSAVGVEVCGTHNGWDNVFSLLAILLALVMVAQVALSKFTTVELPRPGSLTWGQVHLVAGAAAGALVALQFLVGDSVGGVDLNRSIGSFLGILLAAGLAYGGFLRSKEPEVSAGPLA